MKQAKFSITDEQILFLDSYRALGFKDKSEVVRTALERLRAHLLDEELARSADLYAELYDTDEDAQAWVEDAHKGWPE